jgi:HemY protein
MSRFFVLLLLLIGSVWLGIQLKADPGYLLIAYKAWTVEMPLWIGFIVIGGISVALYLLVRVMSTSSQLRRLWLNWKERRRLQRAQKATNKGLIQAAEGNWKEAEINLIRGTRKNTLPLINYLVAARAAQELGAYDRRDDYLRLAHKTTPAAEIAVGVVQAQLQFLHQQLEQSLATVRRLHELAPRHTFILKLLKRLYIELRDWESLAELLPQLRKRQVLTALEAADLEQQIYQQLLIGTATKQTGTDALHNLWSRMPRALHQQPLILKLYAQYLIQRGEADTAAYLLRDALKRTWNDEWVRLYGLAKTSDHAKQLSIAEGWVKQHPNDAVLLLTLGRLCMNNQLWGKARDYFETSVKLSHQPEVYQELGELLDKLDAHHLAADCYRKGLSKAISGSILGSTDPFLTSSHS